LAEIFYILNFSGPRSDLQKPNCQLARNIVIPSIGLFIKCYNRAVTQVHRDMPPRPGPAWLKGHNLNHYSLYLFLFLTWTEGQQVSTYRGILSPPLQTTAFSALHRENPNHPPRPALIA
jgi:hypothetical protein